MGHELARTPDPTLPIPKEAECGEAMRQITPAQRGFVIAMLESGGGSYTLAAMRAGYGSNDNVAAVAGHRMMRNPKILAALREETDKAFQGDVTLGRSAIREIASNIGHKDRFKAAVELLNRGGMMVELRQRITIEDNRDTDALKEEVEAMLQRVFKDQPKPVSLEAPVDADFIEVRDEAEFVETDPNDISDLLGE